MKRTPGSRLVAGLLLFAVALASAGSVAGEGSGTIYRGSDATRFRSVLEWRTSDYGGGDSPDFVLRRRTLLKLYVLANEQILLGSSAIGVAGGAGDIRVFLPGQVTGTIGQELIPELAATPAPVAGVHTNGFSCAGQRAAIGDGRGRIASRAAELAGPLPATDGYAPCVYTAPVSGIYDVIFTGPSGPNSDVNPQISGLLDPAAGDFGANQRTGVTAWDVSVRDAAGATQGGRVFAYYYAGNTGGGARPLSGESFVVTSSGFVYRLFFTGDPFGFIFYANQRGFQDSDGTPLYRNLMADPAAATQAQNQLRELQGGARLLPPTYPIFISRPDPLVLDALGIPRNPVPPAIHDFAFAGPQGQPSTGIAEGGIFSFVTTQPGIFYVVVSRDGVSFDPTAPANRVLRGVADAAGPVSVTWDGRDNQGEPFPAGDYQAAAAVQGGEVHFPQLDVENNLAGGPEIELLNPPDVSGDGAGDCPPLSGACFGAFYDDRGYRTADGTLVGTAVNGNLCPGDAANPRGFGNPPLLAASDPVAGFDTRGSQRAFGFAVDANPQRICMVDGGFGDKKALDLWTYYPSNVLRAPVRIVDPTAVSLRSLTASREGDSVVVRWETGAELGTAGFHILHSPTGVPEDAARVTTNLIPARGSPSSGAVYSWSIPASSLSGDAAFWLEEVEASGTTARYGPVRPGGAPAAGLHRVALPLLMR